MRSLFDSVRCLQCGAQSPPNLFALTCPTCGSPWIEAHYDLAALPSDWSEQLIRRPASLWRYRELLPFPPDLEIISMGEGWTPLTRAAGLERESGHIGLWIKDERQQPTGSFKDRQAALAITALKAQGISEMALASTGNAAAAYAAYCARAGIKLWVFLTSAAPAEKVRELALYGAEVIKIAGTYDQTKEIAADFAARRGIYLDGGAKSITGKESMKTIAFEIAEQLSSQYPLPNTRPAWQAPDWYIQSVSGGIGPIGVLKGFVELHQAGLIDRVPKLGIVQVEGCAPMVRAWEQGRAKAEPVQPDTLVTVLATGQPGFAYELLKQACDRYGGAMVAVSDGDAFRAMRRIARVEGFSMEPAASVAFAGLEKLLAQGYIRPGEQVVVNCSGHTFSAEKHALEDRYFFHLEVAAPASAEPASNGLAMTLEQLDEQLTTIVVIDDNPHDTRLIRRFLENYKRYRILEAHSAAEGIELVRQRRPDLVVLDLNMPGRDGFAVLNELKSDERTRAIPIVVVSGRSLKPDEWQYLRRYTDSIWQKGNFRVSELVRHLAHRLGDEITLPAAQRRPEPADNWECAQTRCPRILVVDDHVADARLLHRLFEATQRFEVVEAHSAAAALEAVERARPDLIILDLILPDSTGEQLLQTWRQRPETRNIPIIIVSAKDMDADLQAQLATQTVSVWSKTTMDRSSLLAHVEAILE